MIPILLVSRPPWILAARAADRMVEMKRSCRVVHLPLFPVSMNVFLLHVLSLCITVAVRGGNMSLF